MTSTYTLGELTQAHVPAAAELHRTAFPGFFLSSLGTPFLSEFYRGFLTDDSAVTVVATDREGRVQGAVVGTLEPEGFFGRLVRRRLVPFALVSVRATLASPRVAPRLLGALRYRGDAPSRSAGALLSSICVDPTAQGSGLGRALLAQWMQDVASRGGRSAYLTTDAKDNDAVNRFYLSAGWRLDDQFTTREGRQMNRYTTLVGG